MEYLTKREQFEDGQKVTFELNGERCDGEIEVEEDGSINIKGGALFAGWRGLLEEHEDEDDEYVLPFKITPAKPKKKAYTFTTKHFLNGEPFDIEEKREKLAELDEKRKVLRNEIRAFERRK